MPGGASRTAQLLEALDERVELHRRRRRPRRPRRGRRSRRPRAAPTRLDDRRPSSAQRASCGSRPRRRTRRGRRGAPARARSRSRPRRRRPASPCAAAQTGGALELFDEAHGARIETGCRRAPHTPAGCSRRSGRLRPRRRGALARPGSALAPLPRLAPPADRGHVLDVATGTGLVAAELLRRGFRVTGARPEPGDARRSRAGASRDASSSSRASAESLPFPDAGFDHLTVTYLLRYVDDPGATLAELARVVRAGGVGGVARVRRPRRASRARSGSSTSGACCPLAGRALRSGWREVGDFLGGSIREFWARYPLERQLELWRAAGLGTSRCGG